MKILILNVGSSSVKYGLFDSKKSIIKGIIERIGLKGGCKDHETAIKKILDRLVKEKYIKDFKEISAVGHRVVHGDKLRKTTSLDDSVVRLLENLIELAPLHQPHEVKGIKICRRILKCRHFAVFDTSFYATLPEKARFYAIPWKYTKRYDIQRYGFHGTSHKYVYRQACKIIKSTIKKAVTCHIGNGVSITAIKNGKAVDTSMGFTPLEGCIMGSRSGDLDAGIIPFLMQKEKLSAKQVHKILNNQSGLVALCNKRDMRDILKSKDSKSKLALEMFGYRIAKYIGAYASVLKGIDALIFTAGIGENSWKVRGIICRYLKHLGVELSQTANKKNKLIISNSKVKIFVIKTDEELALAEEILKNQ